MARLPRLCVGGFPHLVMQRGHNGQPVFVDPVDRDQFRIALAECAAALGVTIHAYAFLGQEIRLLLTPPDAAALSRMMQSVGRRYGSAFNRRHSRSGSLWEGRFRATVIEAERYLINAMRWLETGTAGASSREHHLGDWHDPCITDHPHFWTLGNTPFDREMAYRQLLATPLQNREALELADALLKGWPLGSAAFLTRVAQSTDRRLAPLPRGRPAKVK